jgi:hypothetical protein
LCGQPSPEGAPNPSRSRRWRDKLPVDAAIIVAWPPLASALQNTVT